MDAASGGGNVAQRQLSAPRAIPGPVRAVSSAFYMGTPDHGSSTG